MNDESGTKLTTRTMSTKPCALITGGSRGIGKAIAFELGRLGYDLVLVARDLTHLQESARELTRALEQRIEVVSCDLADPDQVPSVGAALTKASLEPSVLVHCAGIYRDGSLRESSTADYDETMAINVRAMFTLTRELLPRIARQPKARIIIIGSTAALEPYPLVPTYGISKWATKGFAINLRKELMSAGVGVTLINPGGTLTDMWTGVDLPADRLLEPADVAKLVGATLLLSPQAVVEEITVRPMLGDIHE